MAAFQTIKSAAGQTMQQAVQAAARQAKDQSREFISSTSSQIGLPPAESGTEQPSSSSPNPTLLQNLQTKGPNAINPQEVKQREQELLAMWRQRLAQIQSEQAQAVQEREQIYKNWVDTQSNLMEEDEGSKTDQSPIMPSSPQKSPREQTGHQRVKQQIDTKIESGRGAKN